MTPLSVTSIWTEVPVISLIVEVCILDKQFCIVLVFRGSRREVIFQTVAIFTSMRKALSTCVIMLAVL